jgi:hypothetical protein
MKSYGTRRDLFWRWIFHCALLCCILIEVACNQPDNPPPSGPVVLTLPTQGSFPPKTYHVSGSQILDGQGSVFVPYGVHLLGLFTRDWPNALGFEHLTFDQIVAARRIWRANTVALQLASADLFGLPGQPYDPAYLKMVDQEVNWARQEGMNILLVLQYEGTSQQPLPTQNSVRFWNFMSIHYRHASWVFFDVFNEPKHPDGLTEQQAWPIWQNGGDGYVGMQELVDTIRRNGAENLIFIDGLAAGEDLQEVPTHLISGDNIIYAIHPYFGPQHQSQLDWDSWFGNVAANADFPIVADEWNSYQSDNQECIPQAGKLVQQLLNYLESLHIGLIAWGLFPGLLIRQWHYDVPTDYDLPTYACNTRFPNYSSKAQGAGKSLLRFFVSKDEAPLQKKT